MFYILRDLQAIFTCGTWFEDEERKKFYFPLNLARYQFLLRVEEDTGRRQDALIQSRFKYLTIT